MALLPENRAKNRYTNVLPTDAARVVLQPLGAGAARSGSADEDRSYVNASWLPGVDTATRQPTARAYIATQAPLGRTIDDLWRAAWQERVAAVVALGAVSEAGGTKMERYWPAVARAPDAADAEEEEADDDDEEEEVPFSAETLASGAVVVAEGGALLHTRAMSVRALGAARCAAAGVRERVLTLWPRSSDGDGDSDSDVVPAHAHTLRHYQLCAWPDHGVPASTAPLRALVHLAARAQAAAAAADARHHALLVHCSAGIGRTGVFCAAHSLLLHLTGDAGAAVPPPPPTPRTPVDVAALVARFRACRPGMVQTALQYEFCCRAAVDEARAAGTLPRRRPRPRARHGPHTDCSTQ